MKLEIERKYMLNEYPEGLLADGSLRLLGKTVIEQTYLALTETEEIRVRKLTADSGETVYTHTFKRGHGLSREEAEYEIGAELYQQLLEGSERLPLIKTRTRVLDEAGRLYEIDEYHQFSLMTVEAEFATREEALAFAAPSWIGEEIGSQSEFRNKSLWASVQTRQAPKAF